MSAPLLYIHPVGHLNDLVVPAGALASLNGVACEKLGRYAFEVRDEEIRAAKIVAMDLHWSLAYPGLLAAARHIRRVNPGATLVVGGITAGHFPSALLEGGEVDYVLRGDSEVSFALLVEHLLAGTSPEGLPNLYSRATPAPPQQRMTVEEFEATDSITCDWFPTFARATQWDTVAYRPGRTLMLARGCVKRCKICYGSHASIYGPGVLLRSKENVALRVAQAAEAGVRNLRFFLGKPTAGYLDQVFHHLAEVGPFRLSNGVGLYLCQAPSPEGLLALGRAFDNQVGITIIPPEDHEPAPGDSRLAIEQEGWLELARVIDSQKQISLDVWETDRELVASPVGRTFDREAPVSGVQVSVGANWNLSRPVDGEEVDPAQILAAIQPFWSFYAGWVASPALARLLEPFGYLDDDIAPDPLAGAGASEGPLGVFRRRLRETWTETFLPNFGELNFGLLRLPVASLRARSRRATRATYQGMLSVAALEGVEALSLAVIPLGGRREIGGVHFTGALPPLEEGEVLALVPLVEESGSLERAWLSPFVEEGLVILQPPAGQVATRIELRFAAQEMGATLLTDGGEAIARGRAELGYVRGRPTV